MMCFFLLLPQPKIFFDAFSCFHVPIPQTAVAILILEIGILRGKNLKVPICFLALNKQKSLPAIHLKRWRLIKTKNKSLMGKLLCT